MAWLLLQGAVLRAAAPSSILINSGFESGTTAGWAAYAGGSVQTVTTAPHTGTMAGRSTGRTSSNFGIRQDIAASAVPGKCYTGSAWVRTSSATPVSVRLGVQQTDAWGSRFSTLQLLDVGTAWTRLSGLYRYDVNGTLTVLNFYLTGAPAGVDLFVDDAAFTPVDTGAIENLLTNPDFESGTTGWAPRGPVTLAATPASHTGTGAAAITARTANWQGMEQSVFGQTEEGRPYYAAAWVTTDSSTPQPVKLTLEVVDSTGPRYLQIATGTASNATWTWLSGTLAMPAATGLTSVKFYAEGPAAGVGMQIDNCYFAPATGLRRAAAAFPQLRLGGVSGLGTWAESPAYRAVLTSNFHLSSTENALKFAATEPEDGFRRFAEASAIVELGLTHGGTGRGHTFVWHSGLPAWVSGGTFTAPQLQTLLWDNLDRTAAAFRHRLACWDVVNEAINDSGGTLRSTLWYNTPGIGYAADGDKYIREAFLRARAADPSVPLIYNDYSTETVNTKSTAVYNMLASFVSSGVPVNGVGFQSHLSSVPAAASTRSNFQRFQDLGLDLHITELDISLPVDANGFATPANLAAQGDSYFNYLNTALGYSRMKIIQTWGLYDGASWIPGFSPGFGQALPFDFNLDRKPAYWGIWNALAGQAEKLTLQSLSTGDTQGTVTDTLLAANAGRRLFANAAGDFLILKMHVPFSGLWQVRTGVLALPGGGRFQLAAAPPASTVFTNIGGLLDTYAATNAAAVLTPGNATFAIPGDWQFRFTVTDRNAAATDFDLVLDYLRLTPVSCPPAISTLPDTNIPLNTGLPPLLFLAEDDIAQGTLQITTTSSNPALVPPAAITLSGNSPYYTIAATPAADQLGTTTLGITASDGTASSSRSFLLTVSGTSAQTWRQQYFDTAANSGPAADSADPDGDGEINLYEFATSQDPGSSTPVMPVCRKTGNTLEFTYTRSKAAVTAGILFTVEYSDTLAAGSWSTAGILSQNPAPIAQDANTETLRVTLPAGGNRRFARLRLVQN